LLKYTTYNTHDNNSARTDTSMNRYNIRSWRNRCFCNIYTYICH